MSDQMHYVIRGGVAGRERLRLLGRVMRPTTLNPFERVGIQSALTCLDVGCGGGDVTCELARLVGPHGRVVGTDIDATKLALARSEAQAQTVDNVEFHRCDIMQEEMIQAEAESGFDVVYARFLLTHLADPTTALTQMLRCVHPGGVVILEDIDFLGHFCYPASPAFERYIQLYMQAVRHHGGDPVIGPRLPGLLLDAGLARVQMQVVQPAGLEGEVKRLNPITLENIADAVIAQGLALPAEVQRLIAELYEFAYNPHTVASVVRIIQTWGYRA